MFGNVKYTFVPNAIDIQKFLYDEEVRNRKRNELGLYDEFVIGHVGRLSYQKNHKRLIEIFEGFVKHIFKLNSIIDWCRRKRRRNKKSST